MSTAHIKSPIILEFELVYLLNAWSRKTDPVLRVGPTILSKNVILCLQLSSFAKDSSLRESSEKSTSLYKYGNRKLSLSLSGSLSPTTWHNEKSTLIEVLVSLQGDLINSVESRWIAPEVVPRTQAEHHPIKMILFHSEYKRLREVLSVFITHAEMTFFVFGVSLWCSSEYCSLSRHPPSAFPSSFDPGSSAERPR